MNTPPSESGSPHLLLVEDDRLILSSLASGLRRAGYQVTTADSQEDAEAFLAGGVRPDLVILDVHMPRGDGLQLAQRLREFEQIPFIMLSAYSDAPTVDKATAQGALGYLVKPLDVHQLVPSIEAALVRANELRSLKTTGDQLQNALNTERAVSVAVGITMVQYRLGRDAAFKLLRDASRSQRRKLVDVASDLIRSIETLHGT